MNKKIREQMKNIERTAKHRNKLKKEMTPKERFEFQLDKDERRLAQRVAEDKTKYSRVNSLKKIGISISHGRFCCDNCINMRPGDFCAKYQTSVHKSNYCKEHEKISVVIYLGGSVSPR
ncbi:MAG: hypothetical protein ACQEUT_16065 [Bacillota bacterium]